MVILQMMFTINIPDCNSTNDNPNHFYVNDEINCNCGDSDDFDSGRRDDTSKYNMITQIYRFKTNEIMRGFIIYQSKFIYSIIISYFNK